jgi:hypothetical protein
MDEVTRVLSAIERGDEQAAEQLLPLVYDELVATWHRPTPAVRKKIMGVARATI